MSVLDSFFARGFKSAKCKTLLKLTVPRIKLLRNRKEIQLKQMRREIAKLLENGQEATTRIRVEHIIREEKMMAAQEIVELFSELIAVRLPIIEAQRECPLDLKEAISSVCFAAPRCADLPELQQVQMLFAAKYGKEFVSAATELMPDCGVNRQLVELLSVRAPDPEVKLKLLRDIAAEHELDWDSTASETELIKPREDLLNGPTQFVSGSTLPLPEGKHDGSSYATSKQSPTEESDSDDGFEIIDFPDIPQTSVRQNIGTVSSPEMLPFPEVDFESTNGDDTNEETLSHEPEYEASHKEFEEISPVSEKIEPVIVPHKQFVPFVSPPSSSTPFQVRESESLLSHHMSSTGSGVDVDLQDVLAAAQAAAESAERAAAAARSAASLAQVRISKMAEKLSDEIPDCGSENPFHINTSKGKTIDKPELFRHNSSGEDIGSENPFQTNTSEGKTIDKPELSRDNISGEDIVGVADFSPQFSHPPSFDDHLVDYNSSFSQHYDHNLEYSSQLRNDFPGLNIDPHQPQRLPSIDDEFFSYPNLFRRQDSKFEDSSPPR